MKIDRASEIRSYLFENGLTQVQDLANAVGISLATMRRDLTVLEENGVVERIHGAAKIAESASIEAAFSQRETMQIDAKRGIANRAMSILQPDTVIFLDAGTTVLQLARLIKLSQINVTVFTNGLAVAQELMAAPNVDVNLLGGRTRAQNLSVMGPLAEAMLEGLWFQTLFLGASAIDRDYQVSSHDVDEASLNAVMVRRSNETCILADDRKFDKRATYEVCNLAPEHTLITNITPPAAFKSEQAPQILLSEKHHG